MDAPIVEQIIERRQQRQTAKALRGGLRMVVALSKAMG